MSRKRSKRGRRYLALLLVIVAAFAAGSYANSRDLYPEAWSDLFEPEPGAPSGGPGGGPSSGPSGDPGGDPATGEVDVAQVRDQLAALTVSAWTDMSGYSRDRFYHWRTEDGCDTRQTVLARDGQDIETEPDSCQVVGGTWYSVYDGETVPDPGDLDIDHTVPLANAWRTGASEWDDERREDFANDLDRPQLVAVSAGSNRAKGDQDPSQWQPPARDYWCQYAHDWVVVKHHWELGVTEDEHATLSDMLDTCAS